MLYSLCNRLIVVPLVAFLPARLAYGLACLHGDWRYRHDTLMRERIMHNLEGVLGDQLSHAERARVTRDFFCRRSCEAMDVMCLTGRGRALARLIEIRGLEHIESALAAGKGAIPVVHTLASLMVVSPCFVPVASPSLSLAIGRSSKSSLLERLGKSSVSG